MLHPMSEMHVQVSARLVFVRFSLFGQKTALVFIAGRFGLYYKWPFWSSKPDF